MFVKRGRELRGGAGPAGCWLLPDAVSHGRAPGLQWPLQFLSQLAHSHLESLISDTRVHVASQCPTLVGQAWLCHDRVSTCPEAGIAPLALTPCPVRAAPSWAVTGCWVAEISFCDWRGARPVLGIDSLLLGAGPLVISWVGREWARP